MSGFAYDALCVGAHPDDVEIGMGGTVAGMVRRGWRVAIADLTNGEPTPHGSVEKRAAESAEAARILGVTRVTLSQPNRALFDTVESRTELAEVIRDLRPRLLFVPYAEDAHPDHVAAANIALAARFWAKLTKTEMSGDPVYPERVFRYMAVHMRVIAEPSFVIDIAEDLPTKLDALRAYRSQFVDNEKNAGIIPMMQQAAAMWGALAGVEAGEPFFGLEPLGLRTLEDVV